MNDVTHFWVEGARWTVCSELVTDVTLYAPSPTCSECCDWLILQAKILAELDAWDREPDDACVDD